MNELSSFNPTMGTQRKPRGAKAPKGRLPSRAAGQGKQKPSGVTDATEKARLEDGIRQSQASRIHKAPSPRAPGRGRM